jgi:hypothetical protein
MADDRTDNPVRVHIKDWPQDERPREKLFRLGAELLSDAELLSILLVSAKAENLQRTSAATCWNAMVVPRVSEPGQPRGTTRKGDAPA